MLFMFNLIYASTWGTVAFLLPTEIFPSEMRAQGNGFGITGWALGVGMTTLINPILFGSIEVSTRQVQTPSALLQARVLTQFSSESCILLIRGIELHLDTSHLCLLSRNERPLARIDRVDVHDVAILLADGEGLRAYSRARRTRKLGGSKAAQEHGSDLARRVCDGCVTNVHHTEPFRIK